VAAFDLRIKPSAGKELARIGTKKDRKRIVDAIEALSSNPRPVGSEKLVGSDDIHRI